MSIKTTPLHNLAKQKKPNLGVPHWLRAINQDLDLALVQDHSIIRKVVYARAKCIDNLLVALFEMFNLHDSNLALFAVGGYGRGELSLHSDIDILILSPQEIDDSVKENLNQFVAKLWDIGIDPALAVRTVDECVEAAKDDTVATSLLEARLLAGNQELDSMPAKIVDKVWTQAEFYKVKMAEAAERYIQNNSTENNLEPNIKKSPGGLRDIHTLGWICKRHFRVKRPYDLVSQDFLTEKEFLELEKAEEFLWLIRHHLHSLTGRDENKLLFDYQRDIATRMGYDQRVQQTHPNASIEHMMRDYYRCAMKISTLSEMLTDHYYEVVIEARLPDDKRPEKKPLTPLFNQIGDHIAIANHQVFAQHPEAILEMFLLMGQHGISKVRTRTLRALQAAARGIDQTFRDNPAHKKLFLDNIKEQNFLYHRLNTMHRYGVLGKYIPAFAKVTGLMQYDLFHRYTVDTHTLFLVRILHRFTDPNYEKDFSLVNAIFKRMERKDIIVLAAIFHDIAKGRGGDHSVLGETDAIDFCLNHSLTEADAKLVGWLVRQHLIMSSTSQKKDISDPDVIAEFAEKVGNVTYLNHLYVLTVADMNATNPTIWNSWRGSLMRQLYSDTRRVLRADLSAPANREESITKTREQASTLLHSKGLEYKPEQITALWDDLGDEYFLREIPADIIWHTEEILNHPPIGVASNADSEPLVALREHRDLALDAVQVFVYTKDQDNLFAVTMSVFEQMGLDVLDARIITATRDFALDSYVLLDREGSLIQDPRQQADLQDRLINAFKNPTKPKQVNKRMPRRLRHFNVPTKVRFTASNNANHHILNLTALDQPGLLASIGQIFLQQNIEVHAARITTLGEKAEDMFYISDKNDMALSDDKLEKLKIELIEALD